MTKMLDTYELLLKDDADGITYVSLVDYPAVEVGWQCYGKGKKPVMFSVTEERVITGVVMIPEKLIHRRDGDYEYQVYYSKATVRKMCENMLKNNGYKYVDLNHNNETVGNKVTPLEVFLKDSAKGITPKGFDTMPDGTLFCSYHINDDDLWEKCKDGTFNGFSLEGWFSSVPVEHRKHKRENNMLKNLKQKLAKILLEFGEIETEQGTLEFEGEEIAVGVEVFIGETPAPDGDYTTEAQRITVIEGKVAEIIEIKTDEETTAEEQEMAEEEETTAEEEKPEENPLQAEIDSLKEIVATLTAEVEALKAAVAKETPAPIEEQFETHVTPQSKLASTLKKIRKN